MKDYPLTGVGPDQIERVYPELPRRRRPCKPTNPHLHNVPMQIAAERGLPALAAWAVVRHQPARSACCDCCERSRHKSLAAAALGAVAAMLAAGLTEYNFGDSEFLMLLLVIITLPFAANRDGGLPVVNISLLPEITASRAHRADRPLRVPPHHRCSATSCSIGS